VQARQGAFVHEDAAAIKASGIGGAPGGLHLGVLGQLHVDEQLTGAGQPQRHLALGVAG
jgi:hypothetical protein